MEENSIMISATRVETVETEEEEECCIISVEQGKRKCCKRKANDNMIDTGLSQVKFFKSIYHKYSMFSKKLSTFYLNLRRTV